MKRNVSIFAFLFLLILASCEKEAYFVGVDPTFKIATVSSGVTTDLKCVEFAGQNTVYAAGLAGVILKSTDNGLTWRKLVSPTTLDVTRLKFLTTQIGFAIAENKLYKTNDGGNSWNSVFSGYVSDLCFIDQNRGCFVISDDTKVKLYKTFDQGDTWQYITPLNTPYISHMPLSISFSDELNGCIGGEEGMILYTSNGGDSWSRDYGGGSWPSLTNVFMKSPSSIYATGGFSVYYFWDQQSDVIGAGIKYKDYTLKFYDMDFYNNRGIAIGENIVVRDDPNFDTKYWTYFLSEKGESLHNTYYGVAYVNEYSAVIVGKGGIISILNF